MVFEVVPLTPPTSMRASCAAGVHLLGANMIQRPSGRSAAVFGLTPDGWDVSKPLLAFRVPGWHVRTTLDLSVGIVLLTSRALVAPLVHRTGAATIRACSRTAPSA